MPSALNISGDIAASAIALAGLVLVFLGAILAGFDSYDKAAQRAVRSKYRRRVWFAFAGFALALASGVCGLLAAWMHCEALAKAGLGLLLISLAWVLIAALIEVMEV